MRRRVSGRLISQSRDCVLTAVLISEYRPINSVIRAGQAATRAASVNIDNSRESKISAPGAKTVSVTALIMRSSSLIPESIEAARRSHPDEWASLNNVSRKAHNSSRFQTKGLVSVAGESFDYASYRLGPAATAALPVMLAEVRRLVDAPVVRSGPAEAR